MKSDHPRLLGEILDAVASVQGGSGSPAKKVIEHLLRTLPAKRLAMKQPHAQVKKALKYAITSGLLRNKGGKLKLALTARDYAIFKNLSQGGNGMVSCKVPRKQPVARKVEKARRYRKVVETSDTDVTERPKCEHCRIGLRRNKKGVCVPVTISRKSEKAEDVTKKNTNRRLPSEKVVKKRLSNEQNTKSSNKNSVNNISSKKKIKRNEAPKKDNSNRDNSPCKDDDTPPNCGNPDCLCNINREYSEKRIYSDSCEENCGHMEQ